MLPGEAARQGPQTVAVYQQRGYLPPRATLVRLHVVRSDATRDEAQHFDCESPSLTASGTQGRAGINRDGKRTFLSSVHDHGEHANPHPNVKSLHGRAKLILLTYWFPSPPDHPHRHSDHDAVRQPRMR
jgi:hypothetical protein